MTSAPDLFDVLIVGGGASGVLTAMYLLRSAGPRLRLAIAETAPRLGEGVAYSTTRPEHLLNVIAARMSAYDDDPEHFVRFLEAASTNAADHREAVGQQFATRLDYARYLAIGLKEAVEASASSLDWIRDEVTDLAGHAPCAATLRSGRVVRARAVVLASGNAPRDLPVSAHEVGPNLVIDAWNQAAVMAIGGDADVCIVGSGLTMVDALATLVENGHHGLVTILSRHGLMPLAHAEHGAQTGDVDELLPMSLARRMRWLRDEVQRHARIGEPWQWTMDRVRPRVQVLWRSLADADQRRFLRHAARVWDIHRHRIAPAAAVRIDALRAGGRLDERAGRLLALTREHGRVLVRFAPRAGTREDAVSVDVVVNATGVETRAANSKRPLVRNLLASGTVALGRHGIGLATDDDGALLGADGALRSDLFTLGSSRIGQLWESIAIPELRGQASAISARIRALIATPIA